MRYYLDVTLKFLERIMEYYFIIGLLFVFFYQGYRIKILEEKVSDLSHSLRNLGKKVVGENYEPVVDMSQ